MQLRLFSPLFVLFLACSMLCGCSKQVSQTSNVAPPAADTRPMVDAITDEAAKLDRSYEDGWIVGRESRTFKTPYARIAARKKAQFAMDYAEMMKQSKEDLALNWASYVPYSKRARFALKWWQREPSFCELNMRKQDIWIHESLLDASELYWRILERRTSPGNAQVIAHDVDQDMVSKFMENDHTASYWDDFRTNTLSSSRQSLQ